MPRLSVIASLAVGAAAATCKPGYKPKKVLKGLTCDSANATNAADCNTNCCEIDDKTCGGLNPTCATGYTVSSKATQAQKDAWAATAATAATAQSACCTAKAKCSSGGYTCPAGFKVDLPAQANTDCADDAASCGKTGSVCCTADTNTCGGSNYNTAGCTGDYLPPVKKDDGWKAIKFAAGQQQQSCCAVKVTCASSAYSCPAGFKKNTADRSTQVCPTADPASCGSKDNAVWGVGVVANQRCCIADPTKCGGQSTAVSCVGNTYPDASLDGVTTTAANVAQACCSPKATCSVATCPAGTKLKAHVKNLVCSKDATTCAATCCEDDKATCGGLKATTGLACAAGFYDETTKFNSKPKYTAAEQEAWNSKPATEKTKNTVCCTKLAQCSAATAALGETTTPAAVATTTPVAPARLFSEHKAAVESSSTSSNMIWLAFGGFIGMSVLYVNQKARPGARFVAVQQSE